MISSKSNSSSNSTSASLPSHGCVVATSASWSPKILFTGSHLMFFTNSSTCSCSNALQAINVATQHVRHAHNDLYKANRRCITWIPERHQTLECVHSSNHKQYAHPPGCHHAMYHSPCFSYLATSHMNADTRGTHACTAAQEQGAISNGHAPCLHRFGLLAAALVVMPARLTSS